MLKGIPKSIWLVTLLLAVVLGIWPGIALGQNQYVWLSALLGWLFFLQGVTVIVGSINQSGNFFSSLASRLFYLTAYIPASLFILVNLLISAVLGWLINGGLAWFRRRPAPAC